MERLRRRTDFRAAATGLRAPASAFVLQARRRAEEGPVRIGFTVSRQVGNAVERNRVRRRLREIVRLAAGGGMRDGHDYVLVGRRAALKLPFGQMKQELDMALGRIHDPARAARNSGKESGRGNDTQSDKGTGGARERSLHETRSPQPKPRRKPHDA